MRAPSTFVAGLGLGLCISTITGLGWSRSEADIVQRPPRIEKASKKAPPSKPERATPAAKAEAKTDGTPKALGKSGIGLHLHSERIAEVEKALQRPVTFDFAETPLTDVMEFLRDYTGVNIVMDRDELNSAQVEPDTPVTLSIQEVTLRNALKLLLDPLELTYVVRDDVLQIAYKREKGSLLESRVYPVADLVVIRGMDRGEILGDELIEVIQNTLHSDTWTDNGGTGAVEFWAPTYSLVVTQTQLVHAEVEALLANLRAAREKLSSQVSPELGELSTLHELYLTRGDRERADHCELEKLRIKADSVDNRKAKAELRRLNAEAELAELKLQEERDKISKIKKSPKKNKDDDNDD